MQRYVAVAPGIVFGICIVAGAIYVIAPKSVQRVVARRMEQNRERGLSLVAGAWFVWCVRAIGALMILVGLRGLYTLGIRP